MKRLPMVENGDEKPKQRVLPIKSTFQIENRIAGRIAEEFLRSNLNVKIEKNCEWFSGICHDLAVEMGEYYLQSLRLAVDRSAGAA